MKKVSVLIAVYNAEQYLRQCLDSLKNQTYKDIEVLCTDDASTDRSLGILQEYAHDDERFKVFHHDKNQGPCRTRNTSLKHSTGDFVCFLDADDWLSNDCIEKAVNTFRNNEQTDSVLFSCVYCHEDGRREEFPMKPFVVKSGEEALVDSLTWKIHGIYMVRGNLHREYSYDDSDNVYNDENITRVHYLRSREVRMCDGVYNYRMHPESVTHNSAFRRVLYVKTCEDMKNTLMSLNCSEHILSLYENERWRKFVDSYMYYYNYRHTFSDEEKKQCQMELQRVWKGIETDSLDGIKWKFGYMPLPFCYRLFEMQENIYFGLRKFMLRN